MPIRSNLAGCCLALVVTAMSVVTARAETKEECLSHCFDSKSACQGVGDGRDCSSSSSSCVSSCEGLSSGNRPTRTLYGAIAYSTSMRVSGRSRDFGNRANAENAALTACQQKAGRSGGCQIVLWFYNTCGAIATASDGTYGAGYAAAKYLAENAALFYCRRAGGRDCASQAVLCTGM
jgi:Domain of unknown function (DUF4189)